MRGRRRPLLVAIAVVLGLLAGPATASVPRHRVYLAGLGPGITYRLHTGAGGVHVITLAPNRLDQLRVVLAHDRLGAGLETVASMCRRHHCLAAVNGDFFGGTDRPGGIVVDRRVVRSSTVHHEQVLLRPPGPASGTDVSWDAHLLTSDGKSLAMPANVTQAPPGITLLTDRYAGRPPSYLGRLALMVHADDPSRPLDVLGSRPAMTVVAMRPLSVIRYVPRGWVLVVGRGTGAVQLESLYRRMQTGAVSRHVTLAWDPAEQVRASVGAHPVVIRDGHVVLDRHDPLVTSRHKRTLVAGGSDGRVWLVVTDTPMSLYLAAYILQKWHVRWAVNLDGGGSTTMVMRGRTVNRTEYGYDRPVASALMVVRP